jgi:hypothetical protein
MGVYIDYTSYAVFDDVDFFYCCACSVGVGEIYCLCVCRPLLMLISNMLWTRLTVFEVNAFVLQISHYGENDGLVLVIWCPLYAFQRVDPWQLLNKSMKISVEFFCTMPRLKSKPTKRISFPSSRPSSRRKMSLTCYTTCTKNYW